MSLVAADKSNNILYRIIAKKAEIGIALSIVGVPLGMYLNWFYPVVRWSPILMTVAVLLIFDWKNFIHFRFPSYNRYLGYIILFQVFMLTYGVLDTQGKMTSQYASFHFFIIFLCLAYATILRKKRLDYLASAIFHVSLIASFLGAYFCFVGLVTGDEVASLKKEMDVYAIEPFTVASGALTNLFSAYVIKKNHRLDKLLFVLAVVMDCYILFSSTKRTPVFVASLGSLFYLYQKGLLSLNRMRKFLKVVPPFVIAFVIAYFTFETFQQRVDSFADNFYAGVLNLFGDTSVRDASGSAMARLNARQFMFDYINTHFNWVNYVFGAGYLFRWLDAPVLEAYLDMGILGFWGYFFIVLLFPAKLMFKKGWNNNMILALMLSIHSIASCMNSGNPYIYGKYTAVCMVAFLIKHYYNKAGCHLKTFYVMKSEKTKE